MVDYYAELNIDSSLGVDEVNKELSKLENTWKRRELTSPEKATKMLALIIDAREVFKSTTTKSRYDRELAESKQQSKPVDPNQQRKDDIQKWKTDADAYYDRGEYDLAKIAVDRALAIVADSSDDDLYALAASVYIEVGEYNAALSFINNAIVTSPQNGLHYLVKAGIYGRSASALKFNDRYKSSQHYEEERKALRLGLNVASSAGDAFARGRLMGALAFSLYFEPNPDTVKAEELAKEALALGENLGNAQKVIDAANEPKYNQARKEEEYGDLQHLRKAVELYESLGNWRDAYERTTACYTRISQLEDEEAKRQREERERIEAAARAAQETAYQSAITLSESDELENVERAITLFNSAPEYKDSAERSVKASERLNHLKETIYNNAIVLSESGNESNLYEASRKFKSILEYKDAKERREKVELLIKAELDKRIARDRLKARGIGVAVLCAIAIVIAAIVHVYFPVKGGPSRSTMSRYYKEGLDYYNNERYSSAIYSLKQVNEYSRHYDEAVTLLEDCYDRYSDELIELSKTKANNGDYLDAYCTLWDYAIPENSSAEQKLVPYRTTYEEQFRNSVINNVYDLLATGDYGLVHSILEEYVLDFSLRGKLGEEVLSLYYECEERVIHPWEIHPGLSQGDFEIMSEALDNMGNSQLRSFFNCEAGNDDRLILECYLYGDYEKFVGTFFLTEEGRNGDNTGWIPYLEVYCDNVQVFNRKINVGDEPVDFEIDLNGVNEIRIEYDGWGNEQGHLAGISNMYLCREFTN